MSASLLITPVLSGCSGVQWLRISSRHALNVAAHARLFEGCCVLVGRPETVESVAFFAFASESVRASVL